MHDRTFTLPELASLVDVEYRTLHTWVGRGLLAASCEQANGSGTRNVFDCNDALEAFILADLRRAGVELADIQKTNKPLYRAYPLKEQLRQIYRLAPATAIALLDDWIAWARRCHLAPFVKLAKTITKQRAGIIAAIKHGLSNARVEAINTQIRMITRRAFGFHSPDALIALAMLSLAGLCPPLPQ